MPELMVLLQALLLVAGWLLFLRAQAELRAQAVRNSLTGELEALRQTVEALLQRLSEEAAAAQAQIEARMRALEQRLNMPTPTAPCTHTSTAPKEAPPTETFSLESGYNLSAARSSPPSAVALLAQQGLSIPEIARQTGYAPGEVELILNLRRYTTEENR
ncbi:MAG: hypothetical protein RMJ83_05370 [Armatimonadota bacterium]|nr:hypothetical protein [Armatimonadota bacterium]